jgi:hypothetical protein
MNTVDEIEALVLVLKSGRVDVSRFLAELEANLPEPRQTDSQDCPPPDDGAVTLEELALLRWLVRWASQSEEYRRAKASGGDAYRVWQLRATQVLLDCALWLLTKKGPPFDPPLG